MSADLAIIAGSSVAGAISAAILDRASRARKKAGKDEKHHHEQHQQDEGRGKTSEAAKEEIKSLLFEKTLASEAITRVYEASQNGKIDRLERDRLLVRYKNDLDAINEKVARLKPIADYADLADMRNSLAALLQDKISALDQKLEEISKAGSAPIVVQRVQVMPTPSKRRDDSEQDKQFKAEEKSIEQLQKEIVAALTRLEQVELDKE
jgi:hypothetical protein